MPVACKYSGKCRRRNDFNSRSFAGDFAVSACKDAMLITAGRISVLCIMLAMSMSCAWHARSLSGVDQAKPPNVWTGYIETSMQTNFYFLRLEFNSYGQESNVFIQRDLYDGWPNIKWVDRKKVVRQEAHLKISRVDMKKIYGLLLRGLSEITIKRTEVCSARSGVAFYVSLYNTNVHMIQTALEGNEPIVKYMSAILQIVNSYCPEFKSKPAR